MTQPPYGPGQDRPQDRPHDPTRSFPSYGRPSDDGADAQPSQPSQPGQQSGTSWAAPGQPQYTQQAPYGQSGYGQSGYGPGQYPSQYPSQYGQPPVPYGYGYGYTGASAGTNGLATAALVCGLGGLVIGVSAPVAIGLGIAALVQISRRPQAGKGMAIAGLVIGSVLTVGYALLIALVIVLATGDDSYSAPEPDSTSSYIEELDVGECFDDTSADDEVIRQACTSSHDGEIVAIVTLADGPYPGDSGVDRAADRACDPAFGTYVGKSRDESELYLSWWTPDKSVWTSGDHRAFCAAYGPDNEKLTQSVKNSHR